MVELVGDSVQVGLVESAEVRARNQHPSRSHQPAKPHSLSAARRCSTAALQAAPRAPWSRIGRALGVDATTAARRWERLRANGLAWVSAYDSAKSTTVAYVEVRCRPRALDSVGTALADMPWVSASTRRPATSISWRRCPCQARGSSWACHGRDRRWSRCGCT
ncbi:Lrp/AsnC family transcriptional regulator [Streptomyces sanglieri]|uniref:Lrp/AsnC family transcriptional regulator n=1 Tax=Streptomyces sanglieri TaxID=193460 RepID=A0ABW2XCB2_9ACTN